MTDLLERLKARTLPAKEARRDPIYNVPALWFCKPDGDIVQLQGDAHNARYYEKKGYTILREEEVQEWLSDIRPDRVKDQRRKAQLVNQLRRLAEKNPGIELALEDDQTVEELEAMYTEMAQATGAPTRLISRPHEREESDDSPRGIETGHNRDAFERMLKAGKKAA